MTSSNLNPASLALMGMLIVFFVLAMITSVVALIGWLDGRLQGASVAPDEQPAPQEQTIDNTTLVLIAAAAATMVRGRFLIHRVRRLPPLASQQASWSQQGRAILHGSHVVVKRRR